MKEFKVNNYISLKLEEEIIDKKENLKEIKTNIYINGKKFKQCSFLLIKIPIDEVTPLKEIYSIDEAEEISDTSLDESNDNLIRYKIPPNTEFWGHCSNLQVWAENKYNTRLLHRTLAFPLLQKLTEEGDPIATKVFREEIAERFSKCYLPVIHFLLLENYLEFLTDEELGTLFNEIISQNPLLFSYLEPLLMIKGYVKHNFSEQELESYLKEYYSDIEIGKFDSLDTYESFNINLSSVITDWRIEHIWKKLNINKT